MFTVMGTKVSCGYNFMYVISEDGQCFSWGCGKHGVLGHGDTSDRLHPCLLEIVKGKQFTQICCSYSHVALIEASGELYMVGSGKDSALGHRGDKQDRHLPSRVDACQG